jgi:hypothetical protein
MADIETANNCATSSKGLLLRNHLRKARQSSGHPFGTFLPNQKHVPNHDKWRFSIPSPDHGVNCIHLIRQDSPFHIIPFFFSLPIKAAFRPAVSSWLTVE